MKKTKIVSTLGPASSSFEELVKMIEAGVNVVRLNFSHGSTAEKQALVDTVRRAAKSVGKPVAILGDLQGPKIRVARFKEGKITLNVGDTFILNADLPKEEGDQKQVGIDYKDLPKDVKVGDVLLLNDGFIILVVEKVEGNKIFCRTQVGGVLSNHKGINRQGGGLSAGALTDKDREDLKVAVSLKVDYLAISFVRSAEDVLETKRLVREAGGVAKVISKIERIEAIEPENLKVIIEAGDGIMVARGDLAVEIGDEAVPAAQKLMLEYARMIGKPVIVATQMLETMIHNVVPTRAEVSDVANAVWDGTDAVMLSAESATGDHPALVIKTMAKICENAETLLKGSVRATYYPSIDGLTIGNDRLMAKAAVDLANQVKAKVMVILTNNGTMPLWASRENANLPIVALTENEQILGQLILYRNVIPVNFKYQGDCVGLKIAMIEKAKELGLVKVGEQMVILEEKEPSDPYQSDALFVLQAQ